MLKAKVVDFRFLKMWVGFNIARLYAAVRGCR
jgi:hypothetical protein